MQKPLIIANWKSHKTLQQALDWKRVVELHLAFDHRVEITVCPPLPFLNHLVSESHSWKVGAQDVSPFPAGSYTGAVTADALVSCGVSACIVGHSERRQYFGETSTLVARKVTELVTAGCTPIICVDEPYYIEQLSALSAQELAQSIVAFEPINAIGTGKRADVGLVKNMKSMILDKFAVKRVVYGGSVSIDSIKEYLLVCDGVLVGGASLDPLQFSELIKAC